MSSIAKNSIEMLKEANQYDKLATSKNNIKWSTKFENFFL